MVLSFLVRFSQRKRVAALGVMAAVGLALAAPACAEQNTVLFTGKSKTKAASQQTASLHSNQPVGKAVTQTAIYNDGSVSPFLTPGSAAALQAAIGRYQNIQAQGGWPQVNSFGSMKKGAAGKSVATLNKRLMIEGYLPAGSGSDKFTAATEDAVKRFQRNHGLAATGVVEVSTVKSLNVSVGDRIAMMRANLPRLQQYEQGLGTRYVTVNVPAMQIEAVQNGVVYSRHNAIVGRPSRPTPVVQTALATVKFNPYWNAPPSIIEKDIIPRMLSRRPSEVLRDMNITVFKGVGGPEVDPDTVDWRNAVADDYHFRQEPGGDNAMATAKIEFNSPFGIYLHDTPEPQLFGGSMRFLSSGCVRVDKVAILINWILQGQDGINQARIAELAQTKERLDVQIANPPQLRVVYLTAWPNANGEVQFRNDVYNLDGSGFVVGQPLDVAETGERFVLKPIPRTAQAVDAAEASGFSLFRWTPSKGLKAGTPATAAGKPAARTASSGTSLFGSPLTAKKTAASGTDKPRTTFFMSSADAAKWKKQKAAEEAAAKKAGTAKAVTKTTAKPAAKTSTKPADKTAKPAAKPPVKPAAKPADSKAKTGAAKTPDPAQCKPDKDGKLPKGCPVVPKKKPTGAATTASAN